MKRYFDVVGKRLTLEIDVIDEGEKLTVEQISKHFKTDLKEIDKKEYNRLCKEYE